MSKLLVSLTALCLILASCCGNQGTPATDATEKECCKKHEEGKCCQGMTEEQKQACAEFKEKWDNWVNLTDEVKQELIGKRKDCFDKKMEELKEMEAKMQEHKAAMEAKLATWATMTLDQQKAFFDEFGTCCAKKCCEKKCCEKKCEGKKEGCPKAKEGCGHKEGE
jgi:hypothetical protein